MGHCVAEGVAEGLVDVEEGFVTEEGAAKVREGAEPAAGDGDSADDADDADDHGGIANDETQAKGDGGYGEGGGRGWHRAWGGG